MKKLKGKKLLSLVMAIVMVISLLPVEAFAQNDSQIVSNGKEISVDEGRVVHSKMIERTGENTFDITLTAKTKETIEEQKVSSDAAVVLVMDVSNSMDDKVGGKTKIGQAKTAAKDFVDAFVKDAGDGKRMVSIVEFGSNGKTVSNWTNANGSADAVKSSIDSINIGFSYPYGGCTNEGVHTHTEMQVQETTITVQPSELYYQYGFGRGWYCPHCGERVSKNYSMNCPTWPHECTIREYVEVEVEYTGPHGGETAYDNGGTNIEAGLRLANNLLDSSAIEGIENTYVVLLSDGVPTYHVDDKDETNSTYFMAGSSGGYSQAKHDDYHDIYCYCGSGDAIPQQIKGKGAKLYTVAYDLAGNNNGTVNGTNAKNWMTQFSTQMISADTDIFAGLEQVAEIIVNQAKAWILTDPMGDYIEFGENTGVARVTNATADSSDAVLKFNTDTNTLIWDLKADVINRKEDGEYWIYSYTYSITLDTAAEGFEEGKAYATNGTTTLTYMLTENGELQSDLKSTELVVPTVKGEIPEYAYTVEYYKQNQDGNGYTLAKTAPGPVTDLHTVVDIQNVNSGYQSEFNGENYHFKSADPASITIGEVAANNVIRLYYDRDVATVTVNHFYKTDRWTAEGEPIKGEYPEEPQTSGSATAFVGDQYTGEKALTYDGAEYTFVEGDETITVQKNVEKNVINLYYTRTVDERSPASVVVDHVYKPHTWTLENGKYVLKTSQVTEAKVEESNNRKATEIYEAKTTAKEGYEGFTCTNPDAANITLKAGENKITLIFEKTIDERVPVTVTVNHHYTKTVTTIVNGEVVTTVNPDDHVETETINAYKGEDVTISEANTYNGEPYNSASDNAQKLNLTGVQGGEVVELYYSITEAPAKTSVTVNHIYRTITHETVTVIDPETEEVTGTEIVDSTEVDDEETVTAQDLYVGAEYTAALQGKAGYTFNEEASNDLTAAVQANGATVINLYYDQDESVDNRSEATINVQHVYTTYRTTIVEGEVQTIDVTDGEVQEETVHGKAGDTFTAATQTTYEDNEYTVVGTPTLEVTLQSGTNDTIVIHYERRDSDLVETSYTVNYVYKTYTMQVVNGVAQYGEPVVEEVNGNAQSGYVGQIVTIDSGAREGFTPARTNPETKQTLKAGNNVYTFVYEDYNPLEQVDVTVNHHYTTTTIGVDGESTTTTTTREKTPVTKYQGETYVADAEANGYTYDRVTVTEGIANTQDETTKNVTVTASGDVVVDFYYSKTVDNSKPVTYSIQHVYVTTNWDGTRTVKREDPITGTSYATKQLSAATDDNNGNFRLTAAYYNNQTMPGFDPADPQSTYAVTLVDGENVIVYTYERTVDTREATKVMVIHNYYARDTYTDDDAMTDAEYIAQEGMEPEYRTESVYESFDDGVWVGSSYKADLYNIVYFKDENGALTIERVYELVNANPADGTVNPIAKLNDDNTIPQGNVVTYDLIREYSTDPGDAAYTVIHEYYTNGGLSGSTTTTGTGKIGSVINAADIAKVNIYQGNTYSFTSASTETLTLIDGDNTITFRYDRTTGGGGGGGGGTVIPPADPDPDEEIDIPDSETPLGPGPDEEVEIPEEETPLNPMPEEEIVEEDIVEEEVPLAPAAEEAVIDDGEVPLASLPQTGAAMATVSPAVTAGVLTLAAVMTVAGVVYTIGRKKEEDTQ